MDMMSPYEIVPILQGVPITSNRGALGWSSSTVIKAQDRVLLFDTGSCGDRSLFLSRLADHGFSLDSIDLVVLSHFHFDHMVNAELLPAKQCVLSAPELEYIRSGNFQQAKDPFVPLAHIDTLHSRLCPVEDRQEIAPGVQVLLLPGHTPGSMGLFIPEQGIILAGDALKNRHDFVHNTPPPCFGSRKEALASMHRIRSLASTILPGHDIPFSIAQDGSTQPQCSPFPLHITISSQLNRPNRT
ncbi:MAG: MBL fold metallo-hydrolase [Desulfovermiculus sp.]